MKLFVQLSTGEDEASVSILVSNGKQPPREPTGRELLTIVYLLNKAIRVNDPATSITTESQHD